MNGAIFAKFSGILGAPTQDEVFRSINQSVGSSADLDKIVPFLLMGLALAVMLVIYSQRRKRTATPRPLHNISKLSHKLARELKLSTAEMRQLKIIAADQNVQSPLTILLCPSLLGKTLKNNPTSVDKEVLGGIVKRLRGKQE
jgi:hypothetical protein